MTAPSSLHISIVSYNTRADLLACLRSIFADPPNRGFRVSVVDNGSTDGSAASVRENFPTVDVIESGGNIGYGRANNLALLGSNSDFYAILNSDIILHPGSLDRCIDYFENHPECGIAGGALLNADGSPQMNWACGELNVKTIAYEQFFLAALLPKSRKFGEYFRTWWNRGDTRALPQVCGAFMVVRASVFNSANGFDPSYWMYCEDTDLCARVRRLGFECVYIHDAPSTHGHGTSSRGALRPRMVLEHNVSRCLYILTFYGRDRAKQARAIMIIGALLRVILWTTAGILKRDSELVKKGKGYLSVLYGTRNIKV
jgi:N-acetylglucosaminyl-diphospho-decaprenol L-rhamnosyltransferase